MDKEGKNLQNIDQEIEELKDNLLDFNNLAHNLHKQIDWKGFFEWSTLNKINWEKKNENMADISCVTNNLMQMVVVTCNTNDFVMYLTP